MKTHRLVILAARGGVGKTSIAAGIARAAAARGRETILVDADSTARSLEGCFACEDRVVYDLGDFLSGRDAAGVVVPLVPHLGLIPAAYRTPTVEGRAAAEEICTRLEREIGADLIILDTTAASEPLTLAFAEAVDTVIVVTDPAPRSVSAVANLAEHLLTGGVRDVRLVLNRFSPAPTGCDVRGVIDAATLPLIGIVPEIHGMDAHLAKGEGDAGTLAFANLAARLSGVSVPLLTGVCEHRRAVLAV